MTTPDVVAALEAAEPSATRREMIEALRRVAEEQLAEAEELDRYDRCRKAGITEVIKGKPC